MTPTSSSSVTFDPTEAVAKLAAVCARNSWTVGVAESCTGGLLSSWICAYPGASAFYVGGVVSYSRSVKHHLLAIPLRVLQTHGEVSLPVAKAMASGARKALECDWSVSITGIAGPKGGSVEKPVGTVCFAVAGPGVEKSDIQHFSDSNGRQDIQRQAALFAFDFLLNAMI